MADFHPQLFLVLIEIQWIISFLSSQKSFSVSCRFSARAKKKRSTLRSDKGKKSWMRKSESRRHVSSVKKTSQIDFNWEIKEDFHLLMFAVRGFPFHFVFETPRTFTSFTCRTHTLWNSHAELELDVEDDVMAESTEASVELTSLKTPSTGNSICEIWFSAWRITWKWNEYLARSSSAQVHDAMVKLWFIFVTRETTKTHRQPTTKWSIRWSLEKLHVYSEHRRRRWIPLRRKSPSQIRFAGTPA